jgi:predicted acylesterase/phospholipase RssA
MKPKSVYDGLCLSGGGLKGYIHLGALHFLHQYKHLRLKPKFYAGTSVGSLICVLLIMGYTALEIFQYLNSNDLLEKLKPDIFMSINDVMCNYGVIKTDVLLEFIEQMILAKEKRVYTFQELYDEEGIFFACAAYNMNTCKKEYFNMETTPNMSITKAASLSSTVPMVFRASEYQGQLYVDGGVFDNSPLLHLRKYCPGRILTLNFNYVIVDPVKQPNFVEYVKRLVMLPLFIQDKQKSCDQVDVVHFDVNFDSENLLYLEMKNRIQMFVDGYSHMKQTYNLEIKEKRD